MIYANRSEECLQEITEPISESISINSTFHKEILLTVFLFVEGKNEKNIFSNWENQVFSKIFFMLIIATKIGYKSNENCEKY